MQSYSTIIGVIELRLSGIGYRTTKARYGIGNSTVTLIMNRFKETGLTLDDLKTMEPTKVEALFYPPEKSKTGREAASGFPHDPSAYAGNETS